MTSFDDLLDSVEESMSDRDVVGLAGFYLREYENTHPFSANELWEVIEPSLFHIPQDSFRAYPSQLRQKGWFQKHDSRWDLTGDGLSHYQKLVTLKTGEETPRETDDLFITASPPDDDFYQPLVNDINRSYRYHIYDATMILTRKLLENLVIELLRTRLGATDNLETFYIPRQGRFKPFSVLVENFGEHIEQFQPFMPDLDSDFIDRLDSFRTQANATAHSIQVDISQSEIEERGTTANDLVRVLFRLREQVRLEAELNGN